VGYVVPGPQTQLSSDELRHFLRQKVPAYMVPSTFMMLKKLPLTANGKIDRRALPAPNLGTPGVEKAADILKRVQGLSDEGVKAMLQKLGKA